MGGVDVRFHDSVDEFRIFAEPLYRRDPVLHTIELTLLGGDGFPDNPLLLTVWSDGEPLGAALQTPPYPLVCKGIPADIVKAVAHAVLGVRPGLDGVLGARDSTHAFADAWAIATGQSGRVTVEERLYRLRALQPPDAVRRGAARVRRRPWPAG